MADELSDVERKVLNCLDEERDLSEWWDGVKQHCAEIQLDHFCAAVRNLAEREVAVLGEGVPDPYFGLPEHFEPDERVGTEELESMLNTFANESAFGDDFEL